jgi:hypothetical protein
MAIHNGTQLANMAIGGFVDTGVLHRTIWKDPNFSGVAGKGATVNVRRLGKDTAANFAGTATASTVTQNVTAITLSHQPYMKRAVSSADQVHKVEDYYAEIIAPDVGAIGEYIEATVAATLAASTATALTGASARAAIIEAREYLTSKKVPLSDRFLACSPAFVSGILGEDWVTADKFGDEGSALRTAIVGRAFGFTIVESTHIADVDFDTGGADATAYAYHRSGVAFAARMLSAPEGGAKGSSVAADGLSARIVEDWDNTALSDVVTVDTLFGVARVLDQDVAAPDGSAFDEDHRIVPVYL